MKKSDLILVTGGSGFLAAHCILQALEQGFRVRTTIRSPGREQAVRNMIKRHSRADHDSALSFAETDLLHDAGWSEAMAGCKFVLHVASPFPSGVPVNEDELIKPAREGTLRVLHAARAAGVKRVVMTSSFVAVGYGVPAPLAPFDEDNWTDVKGDRVTAYAKSKTLAEQAAWEFIAQPGVELELSTVNPVGIYGPALDKDISTSLQLIKSLLEGSVPATPKITFGIVDVRDAAALHLLAMTKMQANGHRFLAAADETLTMHDVAMLLRQEMGEAASRVPTRTFPDWIVRLLGLVDRRMALIAAHLGPGRFASNRKAKVMLGWQPRPSKETLLACARSLLEMGVVSRG
jgi:nucleoside-diphosphate-sugar epimerase